MMTSFNEGPFNEGLFCETVLYHIATHNIGLGSYNDIEKR